MADDVDVIKFVTRAERLRSDETEASSAAHDEAIKMLARVLELSRDRKFSGLAISFVYADGYYGHMIPLRTTDLARLIGATASLQHALIDSAEE